MKKLVVLLLCLLLILPVYSIAANTAMNDFTADTSPDDEDYLTGYAVDGATLAARKYPMTAFQMRYANLTVIGGLTMADKSIIQWTGAGTAAPLTCPNANQLIGVNAANDALECKSTINVQLDDSAAQFKSATASKGTLKMLLSNSTDAADLTLDFKQGSDLTLIFPSPTTNDNVTYGSAPIRFNTGATTARQIEVPDAAGTMATIAATQTLTNKTLTDGKLASTVLAGDGTWSGSTVTFADCADALAFGKAVYVQSTGKPALSDADAIATMPVIGLIVEASTGADDECTVLTHGIITETDWAWTVGAILYADDDTAGGLTATVGDIAGTDNVVQVVGIALSGDTILVNPSFSLITLE